MNILLQSHIHELIERQLQERVSFKTTLMRDNWLFPLNTSNDPSSHTTKLKLLRKPMQSFEKRKFNPLFHTDRKTLHGATQILTWFENDYMRNRTVMTRRSEESLFQLILARFQATKLRLARKLYVCHLELALQVRVAMAFDIELQFFLRHCTLCLLHNSIARSRMFALGHQL